MTKARDLADLIAAGNPLADGAISVAEISDLTASAAELNQLDNTADLPDIRPSLLLDFANSKTLDPRITFTRGSTATYWDGKTTAKAEENLLKYSQNFNSGWDKVGVTVAVNDTTAPDGTTTAAKIEITTTGIYRGDMQIVSASTSTEYTATMYLKAGNHSYVGLQIQSRLNGSYVASISRIYIDLSDGSQIGTATGPVTVTDVGNGWYKLTCSTTTASSGLNQIAVLMDICDSGGNTAPSTPIASGSYVYAWGAQVEQRSSATAYTPTTSAPIVKYQPVLQTAASGEARFDHDPVTGESKGLLIEEARTNLIANSVPTVAIWNDGGVNFTDNAAVAPDGTQTAALIQNAGASEYTQPANFTIPSGATITFSTYLKNVDSSYFRLMFVDSPNSSFARTWINGSTMEPTGTITYVGSTFSNMVVSYEYVGNGWYRYSLTADTTGLTSCAFFIATSDADSAFARDTSKSYLVWGAQAEQGEFPTSYIPTSGSTVTRARDGAQVTGDNFTELFTQTGLTLYAEALYSAPQGNGAETIGVIGLDNLTTSEVLYIGVNTSSNGSRLQSRSNSTIDADLSNPGAVDGIFKIAASLSTNDVALTKDGQSVTTDGSFTLPRFSRLQIGFHQFGSSWNSTIKKIAIYPKRLPNATLQAMTEA